MVCLLYQEGCLSLGRQVIHFIPEGIHLRYWRGRVSLEEMLHVSLIILT